MAYRSHQVPSQQLLWRQESSSSSSSQSGSPRMGGNRDGLGDQQLMARFTQQRRCSSLPSGTIINHLPSQHQREHSSASNYSLDNLVLAESDVLVQCLLEKVMALTADKQQLSQQNAELQAENQQLSTLVTDMADTVQQQQHQMRTLLQLQRQRLLKEARKAQAVPPQQHARQQALLSAQQQQHPAAAQGPQQDDDFEEVSARLPFLDLQQDVPMQQGHGQHSRRQHQQQQERVAEWLQERGWQEWQGKLEPVSSSSSSSLVLAIEESLLRP